MTGRPHAAIKGNHANSHPHRRTRRADFGSDDLVQQRFSGGQAAAVFGDDGEAALECFDREPSEMRCNDDIWQPQQWIVRRYRLARKDIEASASEMPARQSGAQSSVVDERAARSID